MTETRFLAGLSPLKLAFMSVCGASLPWRVAFPTRSRLMDAATKR